MQKKKQKKLKLKFNQFSAANECHLCHGNGLIETKKNLPLKNKNATIKIAVERMMENDINAELWMLISRELISSRNSMTLWSESSGGKKRAKANVSVHTSAS